MIERQNAAELRAFNREAFQKFGGVEGLLTRFLDQVLAARLTPAQRQATVKVLLALTDLDSQVRAGVLTVANLQTKLKGTVKPEEVTEATHWLARGDVRLITPVKQNAAIGYELAHERLIPALMRLAGKELSVADKANQLLDRRVNEWLGNQCKAHYLLNWSELWLIEQQKPYLMWGGKRRQKERLLVRSRQRIYGVASGIAMAALMSLFFGSWLLYTPQGQMQRVRWELTSPLGSPLEKMPDDEVAKAAVAFAKDGKWEEAFKIERRYIDRAAAQAAFLRQLADVITKLEDVSQAKEKLEQALIAAELIDDPFPKSSVLSAIATAYRKLADNTTEQALLKRAISTAEPIDDPFDKFNVLEEIASAAGELADGTVAAEVLKQALSATESIDDLFYKSSALYEIVAAAGNLADGAAAQVFLDTTWKVRSREK